MRLGPLEQLFPYCAAWPAIPCAGAGDPDVPRSRYLLGYAHVGDRDWPALYALDRLLAGLRSYITATGGAGL